VIPPAGVSDSPTITISEDEVSHIKTASTQPGRNTGNLEGKTTNTNPDLKHTSTNLNSKTKEEDEEDIDQVDPRVEKIIFIGSIVAGVILVILIIFFVINIFHLFPGNKDNNLPSDEITATVTPSAEPTDEAVTTVIMPSVVGYSLADAEKRLYAKSEDLR